jgi:ferric-dicitrate binding protein FerR (iron transport regulator)
MTGEGYFEVAHNDKKPFLVRAGGMDVEVLGTHFNINAYEDEEAVKTTLLEGKVRASAANGQAVVLAPGQQARLSAGKAQLTTVNEVDVEQVIAWKNGRFLFNSIGIEAMMRQVARWYDVEVVYENKIDGTISGSLSRSDDLTQLLKILEATGKVDFTVTGKQIRIESKQ